MEMVQTFLTVTTTGIPVETTVDIRGPTANRRAEVSIPFSWTFYFISKKLTRCVTRNRIPEMYRYALYNW